MRCSMLRRVVVRAAALAVALTAGRVMVVGAQADDGQVYELGLAKHVLIDDVMIERHHNLTFTQNPPTRMERALWQTEPWEAADIGAYHSVARDNGLFRMWYDPMEVTFYQEGKPDDWVGYAGYAESTDGVHWTKPRLNVVDYKGSTDNNLCYRGIAGFIHGGTVFIDPAATSPNERYKMIYGDFYRIRLENAPLYTTVNGAFSPDGIHWTPAQTQYAIIMLSQGTDTQNVAFYDPNIGKYVAYVRMNIYDGKKCSRRAGRSESADYVKFPPAEECMAPDEFDPGGAWGSGIYNTAAHAYAEAPSTYYFFPSILIHEDATVFIELGLSRDGIHIARPFREPYLSPPEGKLSQYMGVGMVRVGDELWMWDTEYPGSHSDVGNNLRGEKYRLVQRLDGFVSWDAGERVGTLVTRPFVCRGAGLELNADAGRGSVQVQVTDISGRILATSRRIAEDGVALRVDWEDDADLGALIGRPIRLRMSMRNCKLYAFEFTDGLPGQEVPPVRLPQAVAGAGATGPGGTHRPDAMAEDAQM